MNSNDIASIIKTLTDSGFEEAELRLSDLYVRVSNRSNSQSILVKDKEHIPLKPEAEARARDKVASAATDGGTPALNLATVRSTTLGTFYRAPSPEAEPFVNIGDRVEAGQQIGIVEVMKLFNSIEAEVSGTLVEILVNDAELVEHGQALFTIAVD